MRKFILSLVLCLMLIIPVSVKSSPIDICYDVQEIAESVMLFKMSGHSKLEAYETFLPLAHSGYMPIVAEIIDQVYEHMEFSDDPEEDIKAMGKLYFALCIISLLELEEEDAR